MQEEQDCLRCGQAFLGKASLDIFLLAIFGGVALLLTVAASKSGITSVPLGLTSSQSNRALNREVLATASNLKSTLAFRYHLER